MARKFRIWNNKQRKSRNSHRSTAARRWRKNSLGNVDLAFERLEDRWVLSGGTLDATFNPGGSIPGVLVSDLGFAEDGRAVALQSDGKILIAGTVGSPLNRNFGVARYNPDGSLDTTFGVGDADGVNGLASVDFFGQQDLCVDLVVDSSDNILLVGRFANGATSGVGIAKLTAAGVLDTGFGTSGKVTTAPSVLADPRAIALDSSDNIVVGARFQTTGSSTTQDFMALRYTPAGVLDTTFDGDGMATVDFNAASDEVFDVAIQSDDKIVLVGSARSGSFNQFALARLNTNGTLDTTFDTDGKVTTDIVPLFINNNDSIDSAVIQTDGTIVVAGSTVSASGANMAIARYDTNGALDATFNASGSAPGTIQLDFTTFDFAEGIAIQPDGAYVVVGETFPGSSDESIRVARLKSDGTVDTGFGTGGSTAINIVGGTAVERLRDVVMQPDGKILAGGVLANNDFLLARFDAGLFTADAGGPYTIDEPGGSVVLSGSHVGGDGIVTYEWDLDGDNIFGETGVNAANGDEVGTNPTFTVSSVDGPDDSFTVTLQLTDNSQTVTDTATINILNVAPTLAISGASDVDEGSVYTLNLSSSDPGDDTIAQWTINWGDAIEIVAGNPASVDHTYADGDAAYVISATATDEDGTYAAGSTVAVTVHNVAPTLTISGASDVDEGAVYSLGLSASDPGDDTITQWTINWGDAIEVVAGNPASVDHTYADGDANYVISATATDEDGTFAAAATVAVMVHNVAPSLAISGSSDVDEGSVYTLNLSSSDPGDDTITQWTINWGDAIEIVAGNPASVDHTYADGDAGYVISATATDEDGTFAAAATVAVMVHNVAPSLTISGSSDVDEGSVYTLNLSSSDPGDDTIAQWTIDWGDAIEVVAGNPASVDHTYADGDAGYVISATATDEDGTFAAAATVAVMVHNVAPSLTISGASNVDEASVYTLNLSASDPGDDTITQWTINWGDAIEVVAGNPASVDHTYADGDANYVISATATDEDGTFAAAATVAVMVDNVDPTADAGGPYLTFDDTSITLTGSGSDVAGAADPLTFEWDLDDNGTFETAGSSVTFDPVALGFSGTANHTVKLRVSDGDGGFAIDTVQVSVLGEGTLLIDGVLHVVGSNTENDIVIIKRVSGSIKVYATFNDNNPEVFNSADVTDIQVRTRGGHDIVVTTSNVTQTMTIDGGSGNDLLQGGGGANLIIGGTGHDALYGAAGNDILLGGDGNDDLIGGSGDDILVGGDGCDILLGGTGNDLIIGSDDSDLLVGGGGEDILIGGITIHDNDVAALDAVMAIWTSGASFNSRVNTLTSSGGLLEAGVAVFDDDDLDILIGGAGRDLVFGDTFFWDGSIDLIALNPFQDTLVAVN